MIRLYVHIKPECVLMPIVSYPNAQNRKNKSSSAIRYGCNFSTYFCHIVYRQWAVYIVCSNLSSAVYRYFDMSVKSAVYVCSSTHILIMQFNALIFADTVVSTVLSMTTNINIKLLRTCF